MKRLILVACLLSLSSALFANQDVQALYEKAIQLNRENKLDEAFPLYLEIVKESPNDTRALKDLMWAGWNTNHYKETAEAAAQVVHLRPKDLEAWNLLGQAEEAQGNRPQAIAAYRHLLQLQPDRNDVRRAVARLYTDEKEYQNAKQIFLSIPKSYMTSEHLYSELAHLEDLQNDYESSLQNWDIALLSDPLNPDYRFGEAVALYYTGSPDDAVKELKALILASPHYLKAFDFLADDALAHGDYATARNILTSRLTTFEAQDEPRVLQLAKLYQVTHQWNDCLKLLKRFLNVNPNNGQALLLLGDVLALHHQYFVAARIYERVIALNPWSLRALMGLAEMQAAQKRHDLADKTIQKARAIDPTNPYLILRQATYRYDAGDHQGSKALLENLVKSNSEPPLPVLLYHGLTPFTRDPLLAYEIHMTTTSFEDQMRSIAEAGYQPVTSEDAVAWSQGKLKLPKKPILISFDDARSDSLQYGDPILLKYGLKATMFADAENGDQNLPGFATWEELKRYQSTGRWEIQSQGDKAHERIVTDAEGRTGGYLANKMWLDAEKRLENLDEWTKRVETDLANSKSKIQQAVGNEPVAFSWPDGNFGQDGTTNAPEVVPQNLRLAGSAFDLCFQQDQHGMNFRTRQRTLWTRFQPDRKMTGEELARQLRRDDPVTLAMRQLLRQAAWDNNTVEAFRWYKQLKDRQEDPSMLLLDQARILWSAQLRSEALQYAQKSLSVEDSPDAQDLLKEFRDVNALTWHPHLVFQKDNDDRRSLQVEQSLGSWNAGSVWWGLVQNWGQYEEGGFVNVRDSGVGVQARDRLGLRHEFDADVRAHFLDGAGTNTYSAIGNLQSNWGSGVTSSVSGGRQLFDTAGAIDNNITDRFLLLKLSWQDRETWKTYGTIRGSYPTDTNTRSTLNYELSRRLYSQFFFLVLHANYDNTRFVNPDYYSPQNFQNYQLGFDVNLGLPPQWTLNVRYLPGLGKENGTGWDFDNTVEVNIPLEFLYFRIQPTFTYYQTPTYTNQYYGIFIDVPL